jgi:GNAT superfamily N-acetyltransferase
MKYRYAIASDVPAIVGMLSDDKLGSLREDYRDPLPDKYYQAFEEIERNRAHELVVVENDDGEVIGTMQLTFLQYLTYQGGVRAQIEAVRIRRDQRGSRLGGEMMRWAIERAQEKGAHVIQLTTDKRRPEALAFYQKLGFQATHEGMKLHL